MTLPATSPTQDDPIERRTVRVRAAMSSDVGRVRDRNEDAASIDLELQLFMVADGVGGHAAGEVASAMAIDVVQQRLKAAHGRIAGFAAAPSKAGRAEVTEVLKGAVRDAHQAVCDRARREPDKYGMATTLDVVLIAGRDLFVAHVGDSRVYLIRDGQATSITRDHTSAQMMASAGWLTGEEAKRSPMRSVLLNAIGMGTSVSIDVTNQELCSRDRVLLCSDGLYDYFPINELAHHLSCGSADQKLGELIELANARGGRDNITGVIVEVLFSRHPTTGAIVRPPAPVALPADAWDDAPTTPRIPRGTEPPFPATRHAATIPGMTLPRWRNPVADMSDEALFAFVERSLYEDSVALPGLRGQSKRTSSAIAAPAAASSISMAVEVMAAAVEPS
jgi:protein phosphatase